VTLAAAPPRAGDGGVVNPSWPWWSGPLALVVGLAAALVGAVVIEIPAAIAGADLSHNPPGVELSATVVQDLAFVFGAVWCARTIGHAAESWRFGLRPVARRWRAAGLVVALLVVFYLFNDVWASLLNLHSDRKVLDELGIEHSAALKVLGALLVCVLAPMCEEFLFRGYMFTALRNLHGVWPAAIATGLIFGLVHVISSPAGFLVPLALLGFGLCLLYRATGSLYPGIVAHSLNNSIAFGVTEHWGAGIAPLAAGSLALIAGAWALLRRLDVIAVAPAVGAVT
jgi:uncharacterized protein